MAKRSRSAVSIGKFDILATYAYASALLHGMTEDEAKQRGMVAAIMGAKARLGFSQSHHEEFSSQKEAAEKKKSTTITAESFDHQVADKMGDYFGRVFLPGLTTLVEARTSYEDVKRLLEIPATWGAKISGQQFEDRLSEFIGRAKKGSSTPRNV
jgi:hypothetical protein